MKDSYPTAVWIKPQIKSLEICFTYDQTTCEANGKFLGNTDTISSVTCAS